MMWPSFNNHFISNLFKIFLIKLLKMLVVIYASFGTFLRINWSIFRGTVSLLTYAYIYGRIPKSATFSLDSSDFSVFKHTSNVIPRTVYFHWIFMSSIFQRTLAVKKNISKKLLILLYLPKIVRWDFDSIRNLKFERFISKMKRKKHIKRILNVFKAYKEHTVQTTLFLLDKEGSCARDGGGGDFDESACAKFCMHKIARQPFYLHGAVTQSTFLNLAF